MILQVRLLTTLVLISFSASLQGQFKQDIIDPFIYPPIAIIMANSGPTAKSAASHINKMEENGLLVRLSDEKQRISYMREKGKSKQADALQTKVNTLNADLIKSFEEHFDFCPVYFYYSSDSNEILKEKKYNLLWLNQEERAENVDFKMPPYILIYGPIPHIRWNDSDKFSLHEWDFNEVTYIKRSPYPSISTKKWRRQFLRKNPILRKENYTDNELLVLGLNAAYHGASYYSHNK